MKRVPKKEKIPQCIQSHFFRTHPAVWKTGGWFIMPSAVKVFLRARPIANASGFG